MAMPEARGASTAAVGAALNSARLQNCAWHGDLGALREDARLDLAAQRLATGESLSAALPASDYLATQSFEMHLTGVAGDAQLRQLLSGNFCKTLTNPDVRDFGAVRRGREIWIAVAAPLNLPAGRDAALIERQVLKLVNDARAAGRYCGNQYFKSAPALALNAALTIAAQAHSDDMATHREFEHRGHDGSTPALRVERAGFGPHRIVGENIAAGAASALEVTQGWLTSVPHCENIMDSRFVEIGIAFAINTASDSLIYWTQDFAARP